MRLLTRPDFDGLACAVLLKEAAVVDERAFVAPEELAGERVWVSPNDVLAGLPYVPGCGLWYEAVRESPGAGLPAGVRRSAPSCARLLFEEYGGTERFTHVAALVDAVDRLNTGRLTALDVLRPTRWLLLGFLVDPATGLARFDDFRIPHLRLLDDLADYCRTGAIDAILAHPDVQERLKRSGEQEGYVRGLLREHAQVQGNVVVSDLRGADPMRFANRYLTYALHPAQNVWLKVVDDLEEHACVLTCAHSPLNRTCRTDVGALMREHGGSGSASAGSCHVAPDEADRVLAAVLQELVKHGA